MTDRTFRPRLRGGLLLLAVGAALMLPAATGPGEPLVQFVPPPEFTAQQLGKFPVRSQPVATGLDNQGDVSGDAAVSRPRYPKQPHPDEAFLIAGNRLHWLGLPKGAQQSFAEDVAPGIVAVTAERADRQGHLLGYVWRMGRSRGGHGRWLRLPEPRSRYPYSSVSAVNSAWWVAGQSPAVGNTHAARWRPISGGYHVDRSLRPLSHISALASIDDQGDVAGTDDGRAYGYEHALVWLNGTGGSSPVHGLLRSRLPGKSARAASIARSGREVWVAGDTFRSNHSLGIRATLWTLCATQRCPSSVMWLRQTLPLLHGYRWATAIGVNDQGWVVGEMAKMCGMCCATAMTVGPDCYRGPLRGKASLNLGPPVLWISHRAYNLNHLISKGSGWHLQTVAGINDADQIVGDGTYRGRQAIYLLSIPEPVCYRERGRHGSPLPVCYRSRGHRSRACADASSS